MSFADKVLEPLFHILFVSPDELVLFIWMGESVFERSFDLLARELLRSDSHPPPLPGGRVSERFIVEDWPVECFGDHRI